MVPQGSKEAKTILLILMGKRKETAGPGRKVDLLEDPSWN